MKMLYLRCDENWHEVRLTKSLRNALALPEQQEFAWAEVSPVKHDFLFWFHYFLLNEPEPTSSDDLITKHYISLNTFFLIYLGLCFK